MPTAERYALNDLQQAVLDVLAEGAMPRDDIIDAVSQMPGMDDVGGNAMAPCLAALKRRDLVLLIPSATRPGDWSITAEGLTYVEQDDATDLPAPDAPRAGETRIDPETRRVILPEEEREERPVSRGLDLLLAHADLTTRHDTHLQAELFEVLKGLAVRARGTGCQLPADDPQRIELHAFADDCLALADQVASSLIVPGYAPAEVAA